MLGTSSYSYFISKWGRATEMTEGPHLGKI